MQRPAVDRLREMYLEAAMLMYRGQVSSYNSDLPAMASYLLPSFASIILFRFLKALSDPTTVSRCSAEHIAKAISSQVYLISLGFFTCHLLSKYLSRYCFLSIRSSSSSRMLQGACGGDASRACVLSKSMELQACCSPPTPVQMINRHPPPTSAVWCLGFNPNCDRTHG